MEIRNCNVAVIGGCGFLGSHLVNHLIDDRGCKVFVLDNLTTGQKKNLHKDAIFEWCDISTDEEELVRLFKKYDIQYVFNYAAEPYIPECFERPKYFFMSNAVGTLNVLNAIQKTGVEKMLQVSSAEIYGDADGKIDENAKIEAHSTYGVSKISADMLVQVRWREAKVPAIALRQFNCFSGDTDVLTPNGIKKIGELGVGDKVYTLNSKTMIPEEDEVVDTQYKEEEQVYEVRHRSLDYIITGDHRLFLKSHQRNNFHFYTLKELMGKRNQYSFPRHKPVEGGDDNLDEKRLKLLAWYITEGYLALPYETRICQRNEKYRYEIEGLVKSFKGTCTKTIQYLALSDKEVAGWMKENAGTGAANKKIPEFVFGLSLRLRIIFQEELMKGDGDKRGGRYSTVSRELAEGFVRLLLLNGEFPNLYVERNRSEFILGRRVNPLKRIFRVSFGRGTTICLKTKHHIRRIEKKMSVYDITAKNNHIIWAGRNGKFNWIGQCVGEHETHEYVIPAIISQLSNGNKIKLGNNSERDFQYARDAVKNAVELLEKGKCGEVYNMGSEDCIKIYDLAEMIGKLMGYNTIEIEVDPSRIRPWEIWHLQSDNTKLYSVIGKKMPTPLMEALIKTIKYFEENGRKWDF